MAATSEKKDKAVQFIAKLLRLTQAGSIEWNPVPSPRNPDETAYTAYLEDQRVRLYQYDEEVTVWGGGGSSLAEILGSRQGPEKRIVRSTALEILTNGLVTYTFKNQAGLSDLYESAAYVASKVEDLMDAVLGKH